MTLVRLDRRRTSSSGGGEPPRREAQVIPFPNQDWRSLRRYWLVLAVLLVAMGIAFLLLRAVHIPAIERPWQSINVAGEAAALLIFGLLAGDLVLPVPSDLLMRASGVLYGPVLGAALAVAGGLAATASAFALGRVASPLLVRLVGPAERAVADRLLERHGAFALLVTRSIPLLSEATAVMAGASPLPWKQAMTGAALGMLPSAVLCALAGSMATGSPPALSLIAATAILGAAYLAWQRIESEWSPL